MTRRDPRLSENAFADGSTGFAQGASGKPVTYILYSETTDRTITQRLGRSEYSYFFVREKFRQMLESRATIHVVTDPATEVDAIYDACRAAGTPCVFLCFAPPHRSFMSLRCPTIPVFAWEFDTIPDETWDDDPRNDWRFVLARFGRAIVHSQYSVQAVRAAMPADFPVASIPAPIWDDTRKAATATPSRGPAEFQVRHFLDTRVSPILRDAARTRARLKREETWGGRLVAKWERSLQKRIQGREAYKASLIPPLQTLRFSPDEVVYTSVFNPDDGRKNWSEALSAFCMAMADEPDATLVFKLVHHHPASALEDVREVILRMPPFKCRVVAVGDFLDQSTYRGLVTTTSYALNTSSSEGQCLPLMEFMSWGKPALAPRHTAIAEYVETDSGFVIATTREPCCWPHDPRYATRALRHRPDWESIVQAYRDSFEVAKQAPERYAAMAERAIERQRQFCSEDVVFGRLEAIVRTEPWVRPADGPDASFGLTPAKAAIPAVLEGA